MSSSRQVSRRKFLGATTLGEQPLPPPRLGGARWEQTIGSMWR